MVNFKPIVFAEGELVYTDGGILAEYAWLLVVLPFVAALVITFTGKYLPLKGASSPNYYWSNIFVQCRTNVPTHYKWCCK